MRNETERRVKMLKAMNTIIGNYGGDEDYYMTWICLGIPDCPSEYDYLDIAEDDESYKDICDLFQRLIRQMETAY